MHGVRQQGVRIPENQSTEQAPTQTLVGFVKGEQFLIAFGDASGRKHEVVVVRFGDRWYLPGGSLDIADRYVKETKPVSAWLSKQLDAAFTKSGSNEPVRIPASDEVDILPTENG